MTQPDSPDQIEPKVYAPLLVQLESDYPKLAPLLIGIGSSPVSHDHRKTEVTARFQTEAGSPFSGKYHTEEATASEDARVFLQVMSKKHQGVAGADKSVLGGLVNAPVDPPGQVSPSDAAPDDDPEDEVPPSDAPVSADGDSGWNEPVEGEPTQ